MKLNQNIQLKQTCLTKTRMGKTAMQFSVKYSLIEHIVIIIKYLLSWPFESIIDIMLC